MVQVSDAVSRFLNNTLEFNVIDGPGLSPIVSSSSDDDDDDNDKKKNKNKKAQQLHHSSKNKNKNVLGHSFWVPPQILKDHVTFDEHLRLLDIVILSPSNSYTHFHCDAATPGTIFHQLFMGKKIYEFISPKHLDDLKCEFDDDVPREDQGAVCEKTPEMVKKEKGVSIENLWWGPE